MKLKLDENLSRHLKAYLQSHHHDVQTAGDENLLSQPDTVIAEACRKEGRMVLSLDTDFADIRTYAPGTHLGIVVFRPGSFGPLAINRFVEAFVRDADLEALVGCLVIVEPRRVRIRRPARENET